MKVLLIAGGWSPEREISLRGAAVIHRALEKNGHIVTCFDLSQDFDSLLDEAPKHDFAFLSLHGQPGEDGLVQAMLARAGVPFQGSNAAGSFLALHKAAAKQFFIKAKLKTPSWVFLPSAPQPGWQSPLPFPLFVKSNTGGSSLHLARANNLTELERALKNLFALGQEALVESLIPGREVTCGVLNEKALPPILIVPKADFFDFDSKYDPAMASELCPAPLPAHVLKNIQASALAAHRALGLKGYSRADFILTDTNELYILEVNTLPGMTENSLVPKEAAALGMPFGDLLEELMRLGLEQFTRQ